MGKMVRAISYFSPVPMPLMKERSIFKVSREKVQVTQ